MQNAQQTLSQLATTVVANLQPPGRAYAIASSLRQIALIASELPLRHGDCATGFTKLSKAKDADEPGVTTGRRRTCSELARLASHLTANHEKSDPVHLAQVFRLIESRFNDSDDPRQKAMATTAAREAAELEN